MFAFVVFPANSPENAKVFVRENAKYLSDLDLGEIEESLARLFGWSNADISNFEFLEVGKYRPLTVTKYVNFTIGES